MTKKHVAFAVLVGIFAVQLLTLDNMRLPPLVGPLPGAALPQIVVERLPERDTLDLRAAVLAEAPCGIAYVMSTRCPFCNRMRATWHAEYPQWAARLGQRVNVLWVLDTGADETLRWAADWHLPGVKLATLVSDREEAWRRLGVTGTPISYVVDPGGVVAAGVAGPGLPPMELVRAACGNHHAAEDP